MINPSLNSRPNETRQSPSSVCCQSPFSFCRGRRTHGQTLQAFAVDSLSPWLLHTSLSNHPQFCPPKFSSVAPPGGNAMGGVGFIFS